MKIVKVSSGGLFSGKLRRLVEAAVSELELLEGSMIFRKPVEAEFGVFKAVSSVVIGPKIGARGSRYYTTGWFFTTSRKFLPKKRLLSSEFPLVPVEYRLEIDVPGSGLFELPGYRLKNGVVLLYITPSYRFLFPSDIMTAGDLEDYAQFSVNPSESGFEGELSLSLRNADYVSLDLMGKLVEDQIFFGSEPGNVRYDFLSDTVLIVSHERLLDAPKLQRALNLVSLVSGHGEFTLRLTVEKAREEMRFLVSLPKV